MAASKPRKASEDDKLALVNKARPRDAQRIAFKEPGL